MVGSGRMAVRWPAVVVAVGAMIAVYPWLTFAGQAMVFLVAGLLAAVVMLVGIRRHRPERRTAWVLLTVGVGAHGVGDVLFTVLGWGPDQTPPFPSAADVAYLLGMVGAIAGALLLVRGRRAVRDTAIEAGVVTLAGAVLLWFLVAAPVAFDAELSALERAVSIAYPLLDVALFGALATLLLARTAWSRSLQLLLLAIAAQLAADVVYASIASGYADGHPAEVGWLAAYALFAAAAAHPSMVDVGHARATGAELSRRRVAVLWLGIIVGMTALAAFLFALAPDDVEFRTHLVVGSVMIVGSASLVMWRLARSAASLEVAWRERDDAVERDRTISAVGIQLGRAHTVEAILETVRQAAALVAEPSASVELEHPGLPAVAGSSPTRLTLAACAHDGALVVEHARPLSDVTRQALETIGNDAVMALERAQLVAELRASEQRLSSLVRNAPDAITIHDVTGVLVYASPAVGRILGTDELELLGSHWEEQVHPDDLPGFREAVGDALHDPQRSSRIEHRVVHRDGTFRWVEAWVTNMLHDQSVAGIVTNHRDITDSHRLREQLEHQASHDALTGLANRRRFAQAVQRSAGTMPAAVVFLDLDHFKDVNDRLGHAAGDRLLCTVADRILSVIRPMDLAARLGGDEFAVLLVGADPDEAAGVAGRLHDAIRIPVTLAGEQLQVRASLGLATARAGDVRLEQLVHDADAAMYAAKRAGRDRVVAAPIEA